MANPIISIICHLYNADIGKIVLNRLSVFSSYNCEYLINIQENEGVVDELVQESKRKFPGAYITTCPDKGRDIGAKLLLVSLLLKMEIESEYTLIIHDKKSPHIDNGASWREDLFRILTPKNLSQIFEIFRKNQQIGIIASGNYIQNEFNPATQTFLSYSNSNIKQQLKIFNIRPEDYSFVAGNIFWIRTSLLKQFFSIHSIGVIRKHLEAGNSLDFAAGTNIHAWERIMSWVATCQGQTIYGI